jgi:hypothetical protein
MNQLAKIAALSVVTLSLGACAGDEKMSRAAPAAKAPSTHAPANAAETACTKAVAKQMGGGVSANDIWVISSEFSQAGTSVTVHAPSADAPWACVVDRKGNVSRVYYTAEG